MIMSIAASVSAAAPAALSSAGGNVFDLADGLSSDAKNTITGAAGLLALIATLVVLKNGSLTIVRIFLAALLGGAVFVVVSFPTLLGPRIQATLSSLGPASVSPTAGDLVSRAQPVGTGAAFGGTGGAGSGGALASAIPVGLYSGGAL